MHPRRPAHHHPEGTAVDKHKIIWSSDDFRRTVTQLRALAAPERAHVAPVIDIRTRERIA